jgi:hypothetical protein
MKFFAASLLASLAAASPIAAPEPSNAEVEALVAREHLEARQLFGSRNELEQGSSSSCPKAILVFARGSTETGNLVRCDSLFIFIMQFANNTTQGTLGNPLGSALERKYGADQVWVQGVGGPYGATIAGNLMPRGSPPDSIAEMVRLLTMANSKCPNSKVVAGGYSYVPNSSPAPILSDTNIFFLVRVPLSQPPLSQTAALQFATRSSALCSSATPRTSRTVALSPATLQTGSRSTAPLVIWFAPVRLPSRLLTCRTAPRRLLMRRNSWRARSATKVNVLDLG